MSFTEIIFFGVLALLVFGPRRLPEIARLAGKTMGELRRASNEFRNSLEEEIRNIEYQESVKKAQSSLPAVETAAETAATGSETEATEETGSAAPYRPVEHSVVTDPYSMAGEAPAGEAPAIEMPAEAPEHVLPAEAASAQDVPEATMQDHTGR